MADNDSGCAGPGGSFGCGCLGAIIGFVIAGAFASHISSDPDSQAWGLLFYGAIPGLIVGAIVWAIWRAMSRRP